MKLARCGKIEGMSILQIELPEEQLQLINEQARAHGYEDSGKYLVSVAEKLARRGESLRPHNDNPTPEQLVRQKQLLLESLEGEDEIADDEWWDKMHAEVLETVAAKKEAARKHSA